MRYRSFFWPGVLILVGVVALLVNAGVIPTDRLYRVVDLWPLILVVIGLELIVRRALTGAAAELAAALIVLLAAAGTVAYVATGQPIAGGTQTMDVSGALGSGDHASLTVGVGAATISVSGDSSLGHDLYKAHIDYNGPKPDVSYDSSSGDVNISQSGTFFFRSTRFKLDMRINPKVAWTFEFDSGASANNLNLADINLTELKLNTGASKSDITLGAPSGTVPISVDGGALTVNLHRPAQAATSVQVSGGAVSLTADGHSLRGIGEESWKSDGYDSASARYQVEISGGACTVTVDTASSQG
jgi:hypothetical protein